MPLAANATSGDRVDWQAINWKPVYRTVENLRQRIFQASRKGGLKRIRSLQRLICLQQFHPWFFTAPAESDTVITAVHVIPRLAKPARPGAHRRGKRLNPR
jgi:hypothetical protein